MKIPEKLKKAIGKVEKALTELEASSIGVGAKTYGVEVRNCPLYIYYNEETDEGLASEGVAAEWHGEKGFQMTLKKKVV